MGPSRYASLLKIDEDEAKHLIIGITRTTYHGDTIVNRHGDKYPEIEVKYNTETFHKESAFMGIYKKQLAEQEQQLKIQEKEEILRDGQIKQFSLSRNQFILAVIVAATGWIGFLLTLFLQLVGTI